MEIKLNDIKAILGGTSKINESITVQGWVRAFRSNRFIALNDGSTIHNIQCVIDFENFEDSLLKNITIGSCIKVTGILSQSQGSGQNVEVLVKELNILGNADPNQYPIQPKKHSMEFLREHAHLRVRTNTFGAIMRIRSTLAFAIHNYFNKNGYHYIQTPIITVSDCEGAGETFRVTHLDLENPPKNENGAVDFSQDFFGKDTSLTVSGQLQGEAYAMGLGKIYTFGPTFRAENSNTSRHLSEFWMIEPEVAFMEINGLIDLSEDFLKSIISYVFEQCQDDLDFLEKRGIEEDSQKPEAERQLPLKQKLEFVINNDFKRVSYTEAFEILKNCEKNKSGQFEYTINDWGVDLQSEHERYLVEQHFKSPVIVYNYPAHIKAFYMRKNEDNKTAAAMDTLFPGIGEIIGGSEREERLDVLEARMKEENIDTKELNWYLDLRRFGTAKHSGFGLGFERLVLFITGMTNVRDVIPYPRTPKNAEF